MNRDFIWAFCGVYPLIYNIGGIMGLIDATLGSILLSIMISIAWDYVNTVTEPDTE